MIQEPFAKGHSPIHHTHPLLRIVLATMYSSTVAVMIQPAPLVLAFCVSLALVALAKLSTRLVVNRIAMAGGVLIFVWLVVPTTYAGDPIAHIGPIAISGSGVTLCIQITLKAMAILLLFIALVATMPTAALGHALHQVGVPTKLVQLLLLAYRYIFVIEQEYLRLFRAAKIRNFQPSTNMHTYKTYAYMMGMLFVRSTERAGRVHQAMKCRGFNGRFFTLVHYHATGWNIFLGISLVFVNLLMIYWEWIG